MLLFQYNAIQYNTSPHARCNDFVAVIIMLLITLLFNFKLLLTVDYGENWLDSRAGTFADAIPREADYIKASSVVKKIKDSISAKQLKLNGKSLLENRQDIKPLLIHCSLVNVNCDSHIILFVHLLEKLLCVDENLSILTDIVQLLDTRVANALPKSIKTINEISTTDLTKSLAQKTSIERNTTWIRENGICLELIRSGKSTIRQAGRGAFAQTNLKSGSVISPVPLNTITDRSTMLMYDLVKNIDTGELVREDGAPVGNQLLLNYCFGHRESTLLLCPMTNAVLINHCSTRSMGEGDCGKNGPNAKIRWGSNTWDGTTSSWLEKSVKEIEEETALGHRGLSFEVVATRDIRAGEEVSVQNLSDDFFSFT